MGTTSLQRKGALPWPNPETPEDLAKALAAKVNSREEHLEQLGLSSSVGERKKQIYEASSGSIVNKGPIILPLEESPSSLTEDLFVRRRDILMNITVTRPISVQEVAAQLQVTESKAKTLLKRLVKDGLLIKTSSRPIRYQSTVSPLLTLFDCTESDR